jgi:RNA recognition motif-containing protein
LDESSSHDESSSDSGSSGHDGLTDEQIKSTINLLSQVVANSPNDYQSHIQLIGLLRQQGEFEEVTSQREQLASLFPLGENIWIEWIEDEEASMTREGGKWTFSAFDRMQTLFTKATNDYLSINLFLKWADFMEKMMVETMEAMQSEESKDCPRVGVEEVRSFYESVIDRTQFHLSRAGELWARYRAFEEMVASFFGEVSPLDVVTRRRTLFHRELAHPHVNLAKMFAEEYIPWEAEVGEHKAPLKEEKKSEIRKTFEHSWALVEDRLKYEVQLSDLEEAYLDNHTPDYTHIEAIRSYIKFEQKSASPSAGRIACVHERALAMYFLVLDIWQSYVLYLRKAPSKRSTRETLEITISVLRRAIRNYPYSHHMWCQLILSLEFYANETSQIAETRQEITELFERALQAGLQSGSELLLVYKQYLDYRIRSVTDLADSTQTNALNALFESAQIYFHNYLPDLLFDLERYWASICATRLRNPAQARQVLQASVTRDAKNVSAWLAFIQFEIGQNKPDNARSLYQQAFSADLSSPETIWNQWLEFEREFGDLASFMHAMEKVEKKQKDHLLKQAAAAVEQDAAMAEWDEALGGRKSGKDERRRPNHQPQKTNAHGDSAPRKLAKGRQGEAVALDNRAKKGSASKGDHSANHASHLNQDGGNGGLHYDQRHTMRTNKPTPNFDPVTLHVAGIPADESVTGDEVSELFKEFGAVTEVRFPRNAAKELKGFAFVQFKEAQSSKSVKEAIKNDQRKFVLVHDGHSYDLRVTSAVALRPSKSHRAAVPGLEEFKHTVFVSNLSALTTLASLEALIEKLSVPRPTSIRMPTDRKTGASRCIAYLDYDEEALVQKVADQLKDKFLDGRRLKAEPSQPTKARTNAAPGATAHPTGLGSLGGQAAAHAQRVAEAAGPVPRMVPRSVALKSKSAPKQRIQFVPASSSSMDTS